MESKLEQEQKQTTLAKPIRITLITEGPAPLRVELPKELLTADANLVWRIRTEPADRKPEVKSIGDGRERWQQVYRLDAYPPAGQRTVSFNQVTVNGQPTTWESISITVTKMIDEPITTPPRQPIGPEDPPSIITPPKTERSPLLWAAVLIGVAGAAVVAAIVFRKRKTKSVPPHAWARARLANLKGRSGTETVESVASILRTFIERRFAIPATKLTTTELAAAALDQGWKVEETESVRAILDECDRAKFAGDVPDYDGCRRLVRLAVDWIDHVSRPAGPR
jgi:hypothetical protein